MESMENRTRNLNFYQDVPWGRRKRCDGFRRIFTNLGQDTFLIGGMFTDINRF